MLVRIICSYADLDSIELVKIADPHAPVGSAYVMSAEISLEDYAQEWKQKHRELERRYKYLERGRSWAISNFRKLIR